MLVDHEKEVVGQLRRKVQVHFEEGSLAARRIVGDIVVDLLIVSTLAQIKRMVSDLSTLRIWRVVSLRILLRRGILGRITTAATTIARTSISISRLRRL